MVSGKNQISRITGTGGTEEANKSKFNYQWCMVAIVLYMDSLNIAIVYLWCMYCVLSTVTIKKR